MNEGGYPHEPGAELRVREAAREGSLPQPSQVDCAETARRLVFASLAGAGTVSLSSVPSSRIMAPSSCLLHRVADTCCVQVLRAREPILFLPAATTALRYIADAANARTS